MQQATGGAVAAIGRIGGRMQDIDRCATAVAVAVNDQNAATGEISQNVASAAGGARLVVAVLADVAGAATETAASAEKVLVVAQGGGNGRRRTPLRGRGLSGPGCRLTAVSPRQN